MNNTEDFEHSRGASTLMDYAVDDRRNEHAASKELQDSRDVQLVSEVKVTEVISPDLLYVIPKTIDNEAAFKNKCRQLADQSIVPDHFEVNSYVLGYNEVDGSWYRCIILEKLELLKFKVQLVDYGSTHIFRKNNLRVLKKDGFAEPFFCYKCKLFDLVPNGDQWSDKCRNLIIEMINT